MRVAITRPRAQALDLAARLTEIGVDAVLEPLLDIVPRAGATVPLDGARAILVTSANGADALAKATARRDLPVYSVGASSAAAARAAGFAETMAADGDVVALADLVARSLAPGGAPLVHVCGSSVAGDLAGDLGRRGFTVRRAVLYDAEAATHFSDGFRAALTGDRLDGVLLFSPRTATQFATLARRDGVTGPIARLTAFCLSDAVATAARSLDWARIAVSARPTTDALLARLVAARATDANMCSQAAPSDRPRDDAGEPRS